MTITETKLMTNKVLDDNGKTKLRTIMEKQSLGR